MLGCAQVRNAPAKGAAARSGNWRRRCAALADDRDRLATRLNALEREMHDMSAGIKQQIEAAKADAIKTAKQAPRWPESAPPVPSSMVAGWPCNEAVPFIVGRTAVPLIVRKMKTNGEPPLGPRR